MNSWFHGFLMKLFLVAALCVLGVSALNPDREKLCQPK